MFRAIEFVIFVKLYTFLLGNYLNGKQNSSSQDTLDCLNCFFFENLF